MNRKIIYNLLINVDEYYNMNIKKKKKKQICQRVINNRQQYAILKIASNSVATMKEIATKITEINT